MYLRHLSLTHFRNYRSLELDFSGALTLLQGQNAQGKSNLLEAIYYLATSKPVQAGHEREVVDWRAGEEPIPYARIAAVVEDAQADGSQTTSRPQNLEILLTPREDGAGFRKQIKINGVARRSMDLIGTMRAVLFMPEDIRLVDGAPGERRRYLDIALCQIDRQYGRSLSQYQKVVDQRNSLLRTLRERRIDGTGVAPGGYPNANDQLRFWDNQLIALGSQIVVARLNFLRDLELAAQPLHAELSGGSERLHLQYLPSFNPGHFTDAEYAHLGNESFALEIAEHPAPLPDLATVEQHYRTRISLRRARELDAGTTLYGPHREDFRFLVNGRDLRLYGSRGQQRSGALATKLAEVQVMRDRTGSAPLLLLDDVMSELDANRRATLLRALQGVPQAIVTTTDWEDFAPDFRRAARRLHVNSGAVYEAERQPLLDEVDEATS